MRTIPALMALLILAACGAEGDPVPPGSQETGGSSVSGSVSIGMTRR